MLLAKNYRTFLSLYSTESINLSLIGVITLTLGLMSTALHAEKQATQPQASSATVAASSRVFIDPETGERRAPKADDMRQMRRSAALLSSGPSTQQPVQVIHRDGMRFVTVPPDRRTHLQAEIDERGQVRTYHAQPNE